MKPLPIESLLPQIQNALREQPNAVLIAPPGSGKTTRVPLSLLEEGWLAGRRILMLEPRRMAARAAAAYMAALIGEAVGHTIGYRVRMDTKTGPHTRIEVVTEGVLTHMLQSDPALQEVGLVIFDEFHERSLHADLGLALCLQSQEVLREDLRVLVMSATLEAEPVAGLMKQAVILQGEGRAFPVETRYLQRPIADGEWESTLLQTIREAVADSRGDLLVFLPGAGEIRRMQMKLQDFYKDDALKIMPLYGSLPQSAQEAAIAPSVSGVRKIVLATAIAETSLTVEGVTVVIDGGLMRVPRFSPRTGMSRLETLKVALASADQRRGRAGRLQAGICYRLWTEQQNRHLEERRSAEILDADLAPLALELAVWGVDQPEQLKWLDPPPTPAMRQAYELLTWLGAFNSEGKLTRHGRDMAGLGVHPRLAHMLLAARPLGMADLACELAAVLEERDLLSGGSAFHDADIRTRIGLLRGESAIRQLDPVLLHRIRTQAEDWKRRTGAPQHNRTGLQHCGLLLAFAFPDRIAKARGGGRFLLAGGRGAILTADQPLSSAAFITAAELDDQGSDSRIFLAAELGESELEAHFGDRFEFIQQVVWDRAAQSVKAKETIKLGAIVLKQSAAAKADPALVMEALLRGIEEEGLGILPWTKSDRQLQQRLNFMHMLDAAWPDFSEQALLASLREWLAPHLYGISAASRLQSLKLGDIFRQMLAWPERQKLDDWAPSHYTVPSGSRLPIDYSDPGQPVLAARLQEMFGLAETPRIGGGRVALTLHLLSPAHRPVQVTRDLQSFWSHTYFEVKKDLKGRYPKHYWPDDPLAAEATRRTRPR